MKEITILLPDENGNDTPQVFMVERTFTVNEHQYIALIPKDDEDNVYLFDFTGTVDDITLLEIESDDEYDAVAQAYEAYLED